MPEDEDDEEDEDNAIMPEDEEEDDARMPEDEDEDDAVMPEDENEDGEKDDDVVGVLSPSVGDTPLVDLDNGDKTDEVGGGDENGDKIELSSDEGDTPMPVKKTPAFPPSEIFNVSDEEDEF